ncbi:3-isopropylmalate dehydratase large subunit [Variovorax sp. J22G21]|uniref:3-isopropylmalate dehydratase large subunit n=1 Tax=Variovorax fucosicus TaxID=3053517 RepID=UPI002576F347|nr:MULTISPECIES: 3-isopropylmalate dehydratase large subunit [unclassified Variovorax]MDM0037539.1 3-isopropylmalate dehydratase large subunit [Variovorax sp. J22R193]MDM0056791.1 3-isopropylmalate dehydratase large subunit [Variovorax sp. J22G47]MDM0062315.1 3-isopropylmalate dehydratase large subunit [Variovorax sp. J22G21]
MTPRTLFQKLWDQHHIADLPGGESLIHIDRHLLYEITSAQAFEGLRSTGRTVRNPELTYGTTDHLISTERGRGDDTVEGGKILIQAFRKNTREHAIRHFDVHDPQQGIVHVVAPELGIALPGVTLVCGDSHTGTVGALGAWAWGIGTSSVEQVLATQTLAVRKPKTMRIRVDGVLGDGVTAKDLILYLIGQIGTAGATGYALELSGQAISAMPMEGRFTLCNMGVEAGARTTLIAPDDTTFDYVRGREFAPAGDAFEMAVLHWRELASDEGATYDAELHFDASVVAPQVTWGTSPEQVAAIDALVPDPAHIADKEERDAAQRAIEYMDIRPGAPLLGLKIDNVFIGSCTNSRISDLQAAAAVARGRKVAAHVRAIVVPGSMSVKREAEALGLDRIFLDAGFEWREPGCSMCAAVNNDRVAPGSRCVSTSNRNFEGRQGPGARTHLASPAVAAAAAIAGKLADTRNLGAN